MKVKLLCIFLVVGLLSCEGDIDLQYEWIDMSAHNANNSTYYPEIDYGDSIDANIYCIKLKMSTLELKRKGRYLDSETAPVNTNRLDSLIITSNGDFNASLIAGSNLTGKFTILNGNYFYTLPADGSGGYNITQVYSDDFYNHPMVEEIDLLLNEPPTNPGPHIFTIRMILEDSTILIGTTTPVTLN